MSWLQPSSTGWRPAAHSASFASMVHSHDRGEPGTASLLRRARSPLFAGPLLFCLLLSLAGCERKVMDAVPTVGVQPCRVQVGELRTHVLLRCGPGCGGGDTPAGRCDVYHHVLICYGPEDRVRSLRRLASYKDAFPWCKW